MYSCMTFVPSANLSIDFVNNHFLCDWKPYMLVPGTSSKIMPPVHFKRKVAQDLLLPPQTSARLFTLTHIARTGVSDYHISYIITMLHFWQPTICSSEGIFFFFFNILFSPQCRYGSNS